MIRPTPPADGFKEQLREARRHETRHAGILRVGKRVNVYTYGDHDKMVYFIECGKITQRMLSPGGKQCLLTIYTAGEIFGELCLAEVIGRQETATAMEDTIVKCIPCARFLLQLRQNSLLEEFIRYLAMRIADQQQTIASLVTAVDLKGDILTRLLFTGEVLRITPEGKASHFTQIPVVNRGGHWLPAAPFYSAGVAEPDGGND